ncbi:MAG: gliding motility-associated C-terminal domain-containing protein [Saprospiraceae bacterium]|nr:gliding motility-associated C-terminal domain-containing protein [Saprospiraceae bacterium]
MRSLGRFIYSLSLSRVLVLYLNILFLVAGCIVSGSAQGFPCDGSFYFVSTDRKGESLFYRLIMREADLTFSVEEIPLIADRKRHITCLGYNVKDRMIYGLDFNSYELLRIGPDGLLTSLGRPENLDTAFQYYAGDMTADGRRLVVLARNPMTGIDERVYSIQVNDPPRYYAGFFPVVSDVPVALTDIAVDPLVGVTYGFDYLGGQLVETNRSGSTTANHSPFPIEKVKEGFGALFFGRSGQLYGLASAGRPGGDQNTLYQINKSRGGTSKIDRLPGGEDTDGCSCPFVIEVYKKITPNELFGCQEVEIEYILNNQAGIGQVYTRLQDILPSVLQIEDLQMENLFTVDVRSGVGTNVLDIDEWTLVLGENKLTIHARLGTASPGDYGSQALLSNLPLAFNHQVVSDDPETLVQLDSTFISILDVQKMELEDFAFSSCDLDTVYLTTPIAGSYQWSGGATSPKLPVLEEGLYMVTIETDCFTFFDSIQVEMDTSVLFLDLGPDRQVKLGDPLKLDFVSNMSAIQEIAWSVSEDLSLNCSDCPVAGVIASGDGSAFLRIRDERGCEVFDTLHILVDPTKRIYVPNALTPNGDGINDRLQIYGTNGLIKSLKIYTRWGALVSEQRLINIDDPSGGWDGSGVPAGVYIWTAEILFPDQVTQHFTGTITLIR